MYRVGKWESHGKHRAAQEPGNDVHFLLYTFPRFTWALPQ